MTIVNVTRVYKVVSYQRVPLKLVFSHVFSHPLTTYTSTPIPSKKGWGFFSPKKLRGPLLVAKRLQGQLLVSAFDLRLGCLLGSKAAGCDFQWMDDVG